MGEGGNMTDMTCSSTSGGSMSGSTWRQVPHVTVGATSEQFGSMLVVYRLIWIWDITTGTKHDLWLIVSMLVETRPE